MWLAGPITVPFVLVLGLGFGNGLDATETFGVLGLCLLGPIVSVLATGMYARYAVCLSVCACMGAWADNSAWHRARQHTDATVTEIDYTSAIPEDGNES